MDLRKQAEAASRRRQWQEARAAWEGICAREPMDCRARVAHAAAAQMMGDLSGADAILTGAMEIFSDDRQLAVRHADLALRMKSWREAERRWIEVAGRFGMDAATYVGRAASLYGLGRIAEASAMITEGASLFPDVLDIWVWQAQIAQAQGDWKTALFFWTKAYRARPDQDNISYSYGRALWHFQAEALEEAGDLRVAEAGTEQHAGDGDRDLLLGFESLGLDCEFGLLQRHYRAEPLCLLRWTSLHPQILVTFLQTRFAGVGEFDLMTTVVSGYGEYFLRHEPTGALFHTFIRQGEAEPESMRQRQVKRLRWLRQTLISDLEEATKIFVVKAPSGLIESFVPALHAGIRAYGPGTLLVVSEAGAAGQAGSVLNPAPGLMRAYLPRLGPAETPAGKAWNIDYHAWLALCRTARGICQPIRPGPGSISGTQT